MITNKGFTLIELMITVAIMSTMMAVGLPSFQSLIASSRLTAATNSMVSALQLARFEAIKQHKTVVIRKKSNWLSGWDVFVDNKVENKTFDANETMLTTFDKLNAMLTVQQTYTNYVSYAADGRVNVGGHFTFCFNKDYRSVIIAATGRIRTETIATCT